MERTRSGFSLIELSVALAVASVLMTLGYTGYQYANTLSKATRCLGNLQTIGTAAALYSAENNGALPQSTHLGPRRAWQYVLPPYFKNDTSVFRSPVSPDPTLSYSYAINDFITQKPFGAKQLDYSRRQSFDSPASTLLFSLVTKDYGMTDHFHFADESAGGFTPTSFSWQVAVEAVNQSGHYLFVDGHVERIPWDTIRAELVRSGSQFIRPDGRP